MATVWINAERCTGCGTCVEVCPASAITLVEGKARVDDNRCRGCEVCIESCPVGAIQPVIEVEAITATSNYPIPQPSAPLAPQSSTALRENILAAAKMIGAGLVLRAAQALGRWLLRPSTSSSGRSSSLTNTRTTQRGGGRQNRHRQRGL